MTDSVRAQNPHHSRIIQAENLAQPVIITPDEVRKYSGSVEKALENKMQNVKKTMAAMFATQLYGDGTGNDAPDLVVCGPQTWHVYDNMDESEKQLQTAVQKMPDYKHQILSLQGTPVVMDDYCPEGYMYFLNLDYMYFRTDCHKDFILTELPQAEGEIA